MGESAQKSAECGEQERGSFPLAWKTRAADWGDPWPPAHIFNKRFILYIIALEKRNQYFYLVLFNMESSWDKKGLCEVLPSGYVKRADLAVLPPSPLRLRETGSECHATLFHLI
ncbi:unnamed protein product [Eretmochelys imbricata]